MKVSLAIGAFRMGNPRFVRTYITHSGYSDLTRDGIGLVVPCVLSVVLEYGYLGQKAQALRLELIRSGIVELDPCGPTSRVSRSVI